MIKASEVEVTAARWGGGYGRRRHLVNHATARNTNRGYAITARCNGTVQLDFLDSMNWPPLKGGPSGHERVAKLPPCERCYGVAVLNGIPLTPNERTADVRRRGPTL